MWTYDSNGNLTWVDSGGASTQPASYYSDPMASGGTSASDLNPLASNIGSILDYGLARAIDVASIKALQPTNTMPVMPQAVTLNGPNGPVVAASGGMLLLLAIGAFFLLHEEKRG